MRVRAGRRAVPRGRARRRLVGAARRRVDLVRQVGREERRRPDGRARSVGRRLPGLGRARRLPGDRRGATAGPRAAACRPTALRELRERLVPVRRPPDRRPLPHGALDRVHRPAARGPGRARARSRPGWRTRSTTRRPRRPARSTRSADACDGAARVARAGWPRDDDHGRRSSPRSTRCAARSSRRRRVLDPLALADREERAGRLARRTTASARRGRSPRRWPPPASTSPGASGRERASATAALEPALEWVAATHRVRDPARAR